MNLGVPTPRAAHGMCVIGSNIYIFGGRDIEDRQNDLHCFDTSKDVQCGFVSYSH